MKKALFAIAKLLAQLLGAVALTIVVVVGGFAYLWWPTKDEVSSVASPDGALVARLFETNGGATTSFGYVVELKSRKFPWRTESVASFYGARRNPHAYGVNVRWQTSNELVIEFVNAGRATLLAQTVDISGRTINTSLRSGISDETAPAGGMLMNLKLNEQRR